MITHKQIWRLTYAVNAARSSARQMPSAEERDEALIWLDGADEALAELRRMLREEKHNG